MKDIFKKATVAALVTAFSISVAGVSVEASPHHPGGPRPPQVTQHQPGHPGGHHPGGNIHHQRPSVHRPDSIHIQPPPPPRPRERDSSDDVIGAIVVGGLLAALLS